MTNRSLVQRYSISSFYNIIIAVVFANLEGFTDLLSTYTYILQIICYVMADFD